MHHETTYGNGVQSRWGLFVALGIGLILLGLLALGNILVATVASVFFVGIVMMLGGIAQIAHAFQVQSWSGFFVWLLSGVVYTVAGYVAFAYPFLAATVLTFLFAVSLLIAGVFRVVGAFQSRPASGWGWILASGILTSLVGFLIILGWPINTLWLLGLVLGLDLVFQGIAAVGFGLTVKRRQAI